MKILFIFLILFLDISALSEEKTGVCFDTVFELSKEVAEEKALNFKKMADLLERSHKAVITALDYQRLQNKYESREIRKKKNQSSSEFIKDEKSRVYELFHYLEAVIYKVVLSLPSKNETPLFATELIKVGRLLSDDPAKYEDLQISVIKILDKVFLKKINAEPNKPFYDELIKSPEFKELKKIIFEYEDLAIIKLGKRYFKRDQWP